MDNAGNVFLGFLTVLVLLWFIVVMPIALVFYEPFREFECSSYEIISKTPLKTGDCIQWTKKDTDHETK